jgi:hypothetical protein
LDISLSLSLSFSLTMMRWMASFTMMYCLATGPKYSRPNDYKPKPSNVWAKIKPFFLIHCLPQAFCHRDRKLTHPISLNLHICDQSASLITIYSCFSDSSRLCANFYSCASHYNVFVFIHSFCKYLLSMQMFQLLLRS